MATLRRSLRTALCVDAVVSDMRDYSSVDYMEPGPNIGQPAPCPDAGRHSIVIRRVTDGLTETGAEADEGAKTPRYAQFLRACSIHLDDQASAPSLAFQKTRQ